MCDRIKTEGLKETAIKKGDELMKHASNLVQIGKAASKNLGVEKHDRPIMQISRKMTTYHHV